MGNPLQLFICKEGSISLSFNQICTFKVVLSWRSEETQRFLTIFLSAPKSPPFKKYKFDFDCLLALQNIDWGGEIFIIQNKTADWRSPIYILEGANFTFWRLKLSWGCFIERGDPRKGGYFGFPRLNRAESVLRVADVGTHLRTPALKTESFSAKR